MNQAGYGRMRSVPSVILGLLLALAVPVRDASQAPDDPVPDTPDTPDRPVADAPERPSTDAPNPRGHGGQSPPMKCPA